MKLRVFYAHCLAIYNTPQEARDVKTLERLGFEVFNPNTFEYQLEYEKNGLDASIGFIDQCDALAFRGIAGGPLPSGVYKEIELAMERNMPIFELPTFSCRTILDLEATRLFLKEIGQR